jgi:hypothetical protein
MCDCEGHIAETNVLLSEGIRRDFRNSALE